MILIPVSSFQAKREIFVIHGQGLTFSPYVQRTSPLSSSVFHTARTLSGSLRSPPSPRGEGFIRRYSFSPYACIRSDVMGEAVFSYRSLPHGGRGTAPAVDRVLMGESLCLQTHFSDVSALFHTASTSSAPTGHLPHGEGGPRQRRSGALVNRLLETHFPTLFHTASALSAPTGHLSLEGKAE